MALSIDLSSISHSFATSYHREDGDGVECLPLATEKAVFGRTEETKMLLEAYQTLLKTKQLQTIIVHGKSGSGKTALVATLLRTVFDTNGYFVSGKYFQNEAVQEPFSAIMAAFSDLCDLVVQSEDFDELKKQQIASALGAHIQLLVKVITNFASLTGVVKEGEQEAPSIPKFKIACKAFLHTLACDEHPIVVFLDDVQWADEGSIALIQMFLQDAGLTNVMLILAYRDEESELVEDTLDNARDPIDIALSNLDSDAVFDMVTSIMGAAAKEIRLLSDLVTNRTSGNPFHVTMFLDAIEHEGLMHYDRAAESWLFDIDEVRETIMVSETLADLLTRKIDRISSDMKETLKVASLLGYRFEERVLLTILNIILERKDSTVKNDKSETSGSSSMSATTSATASLSSAITEGFIEKTNDGYQFTHDKLQSGFQALIDDLEHNTLQQLIGETFLKERAQERCYIYKAAVHLNVVQISLDRQQQERLARINLDAAKYCVEISAFGRATLVLQHGLQCLSIEERWSEEYSPLTLEIMEALARNQLIVGEFESCKQTTMEALCHSKRKDMKINFQLIDVEVRMVGNELDDAILMANRALATLGIKMPDKVKIHDVLTKLIKVKWMLRNKTDEDILNLPPTQDPLAPDTIRLLMTICSYYIFNGKPETAILCALVATELTLKKGLSIHSPGAFTLYGLVEVALRNYDRAYRFGKLALAMLDCVASREAECITVSFAATMLLFRREPFKELANLLAKAAKSGFRYGDILYASFGIAQCHTIGVHLGSNLAGLERSIRESYATILELGQDELLLLVQPIMQYVLNMRTDTVNWENICVLSGEMMDENQFLAQAWEKNETPLIMLAYSTKARIACNFGQFEVAESYFDILTKTCGKNAVKFTYGGSPYYWDVARTYLSLYRRSGKWRYVRQGRKYMRVLQQMASDGCPDASVRHTFLKAQEASVRKTALADSTLRATYQDALKCLADSEYFHLEGLLSENAGFEFGRRGLREEAKVYFDRALDIYANEWEATAKYNQLSQTMHFWTRADGRSSTAKAISGMRITVASNK